MKPRQKKFVFAGVLAALLLAVVELASMAFFRASRDRFTFFDPDDYLVPDRHVEKFQDRFDADLGWDYIANSADSPVWDTTGGKFGPFQNQLQSNYFRCGVEMVEGDYQGWCVDFLRGHRSATHHDSLFKYG